MILSRGVYGSSAEVEAEVEADAELNDGVSVSDERDPG